MEAMISTNLKINLFFIVLYTLCTLLGYKITSLQSPRRTAKKRQKMFIFVSENNKLEGVKVEKILKNF